MCMVMCLSNFSQPKCNNYSSIFLYSDNALLFQNYSQNNFLKPSCYNHGINLYKHHMMDRYRVIYSKLMNLFGYNLYIQYLYIKLHYYYIYIIFYIHAYIHIYTTVSAIISQPLYTFTLFINLYTCTIYRTRTNFRGVLIFVIFVINSLFSRKLIPKTRHIFNNVCTCTIQSQNFIPQKITFVSI